MAQVAQKNLFSITGMHHAPAAAKTALIADAVELLEIRLLLKICDRLQPADEEKFLDLLEHGTEEEKHIFLSRAVPDFSALVDNEVAHIKKEAAAYVSI